MEGCGTERHDQIVEDDELWRIRVVPRASTDVDCGWCVACGQYLERAPRPTRQPEPSTPLPRRP